MPIRVPVSGETPDKERQGYRKSGPTAALERGTRRTTQAGQDLPTVTRWAGPLYLPVVLLILASGDERPMNPERKEANSSSQHSAPAFTVQPCFIER